MRRGFETEGIQDVWHRERVLEMSTTHSPWRGDVCMLALIEYLQFAGIVRIYGCMPLPISDNP